MLAQGDQSPTLHTWQANLNYAIEAGMPPLIPLGSSQSVITALPALALLQQLSGVRTDMTIPTLLSGGSSGAWLAALFLTAEGTPAQAVSGGQSPAPVVLFSGVDGATHMASAGTLPLAPAGLRPPGDRGLPMGVHEAVAPTLQPAAPLMWENLPFRVMEAGDGATGMPPASRWMGWIAALLVAMMILGALIF